MRTKPRPHVHGWLVALFASASCALCTSAAQAQGWQSAFEGGVVVERDGRDTRLPLTALGGGVEYLALSPGRVSWRFECEAIQTRSATSMVSSRGPGGTTLVGTNDESFQQAFFSALLGIRLLRGRMPVTVLVGPGIERRTTTFGESGETLASSGAVISQRSGSTTGVFPWLQFAVGVESEPRAGRHLSFVPRVVLWNQVPVGGGTTGSYTAVRLSVRWTFG
jgi:hypothetical protein